MNRSCRTALERCNEYSVLDTARLKAQRVLPNLRLAHAQMRAVGIVHDCHCSSSLIAECSVQDISFRLSVRGVGTRSYSAKPAYYAVVAQRRKAARKSRSGEISGKTEAPPTVITTLDPEDLTSSRYVDLSGKRDVVFYVRSRIPANEVSTGTSVHARFSCVLTLDTSGIDDEQDRKATEQEGSTLGEQYGRRRVSVSYWKDELFPPNTAGFFYLADVPFYAPQLSRSIRFRVTNNSDPSSFDAPTSYDLPLFTKPIPVGSLTARQSKTSRENTFKGQHGSRTPSTPYTPDEPHIPWSISIINEQAKGFTPLLEESRAFQSPLARALFERLPFYQGTQGIGSRPQIVYALRQPFLLGFDAPMARVRTVSAAKGSYTRDVKILKIRLPELSEGMFYDKLGVSRTRRRGLTPVANRVPLFEGLAVAQLERIGVTRTSRDRREYTEDPDPRTNPTWVAVRILKILRPIAFHRGLPADLRAVLDERAWAPWVREGGLLPSANVVPWLAPDGLLARGVSWEAKRDLRCVWAWTAPPVPLELSKREQWAVRDTQEEEEQEEQADQSAAAQSGLLQSEEMRLEDGDEQALQERREMSPREKSLVANLGVSMAEELRRKRRQRMAELEEQRMQRPEKAAKYKAIGEAIAALQGLKDVPRGTWQF
ncbi:hypothetical protein EIP86_011458 [Pleurotus ostreatoroseus]|nr:hypothetical protein EIP86_011458 [Pleurotus ostreatoroseus]